MTSPKMINSEKGKKLAEIQENERKNGFFWGGGPSIS
jgi:hypothetical protein